MQRRSDTVTARRYHRAVNILNTKALPLPDWSKPEPDSAALEKQFSDFKAGYLADVDSMYNDHAAGYFSEMRERQIEAQSISEGARPEFRTKLSARNRAMRLDWEDDVNRTKDRYNAMCQSYTTRIRKRKTEEAVAQNRRMQSFPEDVDDYFGRPPAIRAPFARYLMSTDERYKNALAERNEWHVSALQRIYDSDKTFKAKVAADVLEMRTSDPRRPVK